MKPKEKKQSVKNKNRKVNGLTISINFANIIQRKRSNFRNKYKVEKINQTGLNLKLQKW